MKRVMLAASVVAALAAAANAAEVNLFFTSPAALNGATDPTLAMAGSINPVIPAGVSVPVDMWMAIPVGAPGITGMGLDLVAALGSTGTGTTAFMPARWAGLLTEGSAGSVWSGLLYSTAATPVGPGGAQPVGAPQEPQFPGYLVYLVNSFNVTGQAGDAINLQISDFSSIGNPAGNARAAFGFGVPVPGTGQNWDTSGYFTADGTDAGNAGTAQGFDADGAVNGPVSTRIPDLTVVPEPTTMALLGLAGLLLRRRK